MYSIYKASVSPGFVQQITPYFEYIELQRQFSHLNGRKLDRRLYFSKLSWVARTTTVPTPFSLIVLPFDKVALAFMF
jgi:hypothetical protein